MEKISAPIDWTGATLEQLKKRIEDNAAELRAMEVETTRQRLRDEREKKDNLLDGPVPSKEQREAERRAADRIEKTRLEISQLWSAGLEAEMRQEAAILQNPQIDKDFASFKDFCRRWSFDSLPAPAEAIVAFLGQSKPREISRLYRSIKAVHAAYYDDPTNDILVRALVRQARAEKKNPPGTKGH